MKRILFFTLMTISMFSCEQSELDFSCDPVINKFVVDNREDLINIDVYELVSYDHLLQRAIYNSWDYKKKRSVWMDKLQHVLTNNCLTEMEITHIQKLIEHIQPDYFLKANIEMNREVRSLFAKEWISYSINKLGWSNKFIAFMVYRLYTDQSQFDAELSILKSIGKNNTINSESDNCNCSTASDYCGSATCKSDGCTITSGCGWVWSMPCDGRCL